MGLIDVLILIFDIVIAANPIPVAWNVDKMNYTLAAMSDHEVSMRT